MKGQQCLLPFYIRCLSGFIGNEPNLASDARRQYQSGDDELRDTKEAKPRDEMIIITNNSLLSVLAGSADPARVAAGEVLVNGLPMDAAMFRRVSGHVPQDDALLPGLTVEESLVYSARLRLRSGGTSSGAEDRARELMAELGLGHVAASRVADVSGGERRRVSIGVELVHDPAVLLLDEPTSGLDSGSALHIVKMLRDMAAAHAKTVVLTIHQPGFRILELIDRVVLLADGAVRHHGSLDFLHSRLVATGHALPAHVNVLEYAMETIDSLKPDVAVATAVTAITAASSANRDDDVAPVLTVPSSARRAGYANSPAAEARILAGRFAKTMLRTPQLFAARMAQSVLAGAFLGSIFLGTTDLQSRLGFFAFTLTYLLSSTTEALPVFLQERRTLEREISRGAYRVSSYVASNAGVFLPFLLAAAVLYAAPVYWLVGLAREPAAFAYFVLVVWLVMLTANSFVACLGALVPNYIVGNSVVAGLIGCFFLFSGYFVAGKNIPRYWVFMHYASLFKYPFEALVVNEYGGARGARECLASAGGAGGLCVLDGAGLLRQQGMREGMRWSNLGVMLGFVVGYRVLCFVFLSFRCHRTWR
ncbi:ABC transporter G family member 10 isoform X1 [Zea mays]|jgi:ABC-type multidrug transport system ATPase subunit|uniref:ABC transporter G family member 10 isoform X1 n=1 Tax=Zea mays TaxID=4577 RepID=UPI0004DEA0A3|nr:ABC transporter G family member 10 isoform X1 [Zea mays]|eukprot:XP_008654916.1 ABC transporter G family member 10 isoform X1 [Zea mays]